MKISTVLILSLASFSGVASAGIIPLYCKDFIALTETAVQYRDTKISKSKSLQYLGSDDFMSNRDKKTVRQMIERVYQKAGEGLTYHVNQTKEECVTKLSTSR
jgi:hypothetical protein